MQKTREQEQPKTARAVYLRAGEAVVGQEVHFSRGRDLVSGVIAALDEIDPKRPKRARGCTVKVGRKTVRRPENELFVMVVRESA